MQLRRCDSHLPPLLTCCSVVDLSRRRSRLSTLKWPLFPADARPENRAGAMSKKEPERLCFITAVIETVFTARRKGQACRGDKPSPVRCLRRSLLLHERRY